MKSKLELSINFIIYILQIIASIALVYTIFKVQFIPQKYILILSALLLLALIIEYFLIFYKKPKSKRSIFTQFVSIVLSGCMFVGCMYVNKIGTVVDLLSEESFQSRAISLIVLADSEINNEYTIEGHTFGYIDFIDQETMNYAINEMKTNIEDIQFVVYSDYQSLIDALYNKEVDGILLDEAFRSLIEDIKETLSDDTRVVYQVKKDAGSVSANVIDVANKPFLVYISGNDEYGEITTVCRSDVNMLAAVNPSTKQILLVSIPRDTYYPLDRNGQLDKFTHAGIWGLQESINTLENIIDEDINYYCKMNFTSFINIIDALGGITIYSEQAFTTKIGKFDIHEGYNNLTGKQALWFVRERKSFVDGDFQRGRNQQKMIKAVIEKVCSPAILTSFSSILDIVSRSIDTNMSQQEMNALVQLQLKEMPKWDIQTCQIKGNPSTKPCYSAGNQELSVIIPFDSSIDEIRDILNEFMSGEKINLEQE